MQIRSFEDARESLKDHPILRMARGEGADYTPVWIMRQAGRYSPRYREIREKAGSFMDLCKNPELSALVTQIPVEEIGVDAMILFSDILVPVEKMGVSVEFVEGRGPVITPPVRSLGDAKKLKVPDPERDLPYVLETVRKVKEERRDVPLIGFSGAPFTLASYLVEGGTSKNHVKVKEIMWSGREIWKELMEKLTEMVSSYLIAQIDAGVDLVQIFDSWMGILSKEDYGEYVFPYTQRVVDAVKKERPGVPVIHFGVGASHLLEFARDLNADVVGLDWRTDISTAIEITRKPVQGNLDPAVLFADEETIRRKVERIVREGLKAKGHIFNLGHGILPSTDLRKARFLVDTVHRISRELRR